MLKGHTFASGASKEHQGKNKNKTQLSYLVDLDQIIEEV